MLAAPVEMTAKGKGARDGSRPLHGQIQRQRRCLARMPDGELLLKLAARVEQGPERADAG